MGAILKSIITNIKKKDNSLYMQYIDKYLAERNYTPENDEQALKNKYEEILCFFRKNLQINEKIS